jgi:hypothetical protein
VNIGEESEPIEMPIPLDPNQEPVHEPIPQTAPVQEPAKVSLSERESYMKSGRE